MRIATFNILHGRSLDDGRVDLDRFAAAVAALDADVLGLQEVDRDQPRSLGADLTAVAAQALGATGSRFVAALSGTPGSTWVAATGEERPGSASYGIALLSRFPVVSWRVLRLAPLHVRVPLWSPVTRRPFLAPDEPRAAVAAVVDSPQGRITVATTHLSFVPGWNAVQLRRLTRARDDELLVLTGDLNLRPGAAARVSGLHPLAAARTYPADRPTRQLDHVLARGPLRAAGPAATPRLPVSDHRALVVPVQRV